VYEVVPAAAQDLIAIRALLQRSGLPTSDLDSARPDFMLIRENDCVIAAGALQRFGSSALLRSVVVAPEHRERGLGRAMVSELERLARTAHVNQFVLLTQKRRGILRAPGLSRYRAEQGAPRGAIERGVPFAVPELCDLHGQEPDERGLEHAMDAVGRTPRAAARSEAKARR